MRVFVFCIFFFFYVGTLEEKFQVLCSFCKAPCDLCHQVLQFKRSFVCVCSQTVEEEALIKNNNTCKDFLIEAMKYHLLPLDQRQLIKNPRTKPRTPVSLPKVS